MRPHEVALSLFYQTPLTLSVYSTSVIVVATHQRAHCSPLLIRLASKLMLFARFPQAQSISISSPGPTGKIIRSALNSPQLVPTVSPPPPPPPAGDQRLAAAVQVLVAVEAINRPTPPSAVVNSTATVFMATRALAKRPRLRERSNS